MKGKKCLVAFFSRKGNNYASGKIVNLPVGNTEVIAKMISEIAEGDMFHIDTVKTYPKDYYETADVAKKELNNEARPELTNRVSDMDSYDVVFLGYPIWWGTMPMAVFTFLESYDFSGKTIIPFCTHEGSGLGHSVRDIRRVCPGATVTDEVEFLGSTVNSAEDEVIEWIKSIETFYYFREMLINL